MTVAPQRVALVTGAAGGIGGATLALLRERGYAVVAEDVSPKVGALAGDAVATLEADVLAPDTARRAVALALERFGRLDLLVNNAGLFMRKPGAQSTDEDFDVLMSVNVRSAFSHSREALYALEDSKGSIVNLASISGLVGQVGQLVYSLTKGAIVQLTRQMAVEQAPRGIRVNAVAPGAVDTDFIAKGRDAAADPDPVASRAASIANHPVGRLLTAREVAQAIVFLGSEQASGITGAILPVDGGFTAR